MAAPHSAFNSLDDAKRAMRGASFRARAGHDAPVCGQALARHVLDRMPPPSGAVVSGFWPLGEEIDIRPLLEALMRRGHVTVLPVTPKRGLPLTFREWTLGAAMEPERFGTLRPTGPERVPDWLFVPLLAFDRRCHRLGYGAGYYDRTLAALPAARVAVGCAYAAQEVDAVPIGPYDVALDAVATERGVIMREAG